MPALAVVTPEDGLAGAIMPLGFAAATDTALMVDLDPDGPRYPGSGSLAALVEAGPRRIDLEPARQGLAVLRNGGVTYADAAEVVNALIEGWPNVVLRLPADEPPALPMATVPVRMLHPGRLFPQPQGAAVQQRTGWRGAEPGPGPVLPRPRPATWRALALGTNPPPDRWLRACRTVWGFPWTR